MSEDLFYLDTEQILLKNHNFTFQTTNEYVYDIIYQLMRNILNDSFNIELVYINTLFFQNNWRKQFDIKRTKNDFFFDDNNQMHEVLMMSQHDRYRIYVDQPNNFMVLFISLLQEYTYGVIILPNLGFELKDMLMNFRV
ncbi:hypothetical protein RF11_07943 [Thelohanellus kitauei]|uniref:Serpin domain-containing protein n=1 Tax=Thelohanellus kitauei TaxID=669202 RepID=A0A0C2IK39_THEKT|nr:hypothetical protein RF11_07943 [Thelohanellus kitauei]